MIVFRFCQGDPVPPFTQGSHIGFDRFFAGVPIQNGPLQKPKGTTCKKPEGFTSQPNWPWPQPPVTPPPQGKVMLMAGERELTTGLLAKDVSLIVSGKVGVKEIERLIQKLEIDKEIPADQENEAHEEAAN
jgi:hypothetical protein